MGQDDGERSNRHNPIITAIKNRRRRRILTILLDSGPEVTEAELATTLAATEREQTVLDVATRETRTIRVDLHHVQLPILEDCGLITRERETATVATTDHPILRDSKFQRLINLEAESLDDVLGAISHERRRVALSILRSERTALSPTALAREILRRETSEAEPEQAAVEDLGIALTHCHLPKLARTDLVEYHPEPGRAEYTGHPVLEEVATIIHEPDESLVDKLDGILDGLEEASRRTGRETDGRLDWPDLWTDVHHG